MIRAHGVDVLLHTGETLVFAQLSVRHHEAVVSRLLQEHLLIIPLVILHQGALALSTQDFKNGPLSPGQTLALPGYSSHV